ncbi:MAG: hypothetical protein D8M59_02250 [Planctomycetes bacterium]|nr:hypothetical protein [Planctomycetota bacterium]NOG54458.1 hypothetical protein [Planctomycetota bacterium]
MADALDRIDRFESVFRRADKQHFAFRQLPFGKALLITDDARATTEGQPYPWHPLVEALGSEGTGPEIAEVVVGLDGVRVIADLHEHIRSLQPDLLITHRNVADPVTLARHSLGVVVDELTQQTKIPVLLLPDDTTGVSRSPASVMVITSHLYGDHTLVSSAVRFTTANGTLWLCHIEDDEVFDRYIEAIGKIPDINTDLARERLHDVLLGEPTEYVESCTTELGQVRPDVTVKSVIRLGHRVADFRRLVDEHAVDLVVFNTKDETQIAMHGMAYSIAVEFSDVPLLML